MNDTAQEMPTAVTFMRWAARIWSAMVIAVTAFILIGHLVLEDNAGAKPVSWDEYMMPLSMLISVLGLVIAWRRQVLGSAICIGFALLNLAIYIIVGGTRPVSVFGLVVLPVILPALLFLGCALFSQAAKRN